MKQARDRAAQILARSVSSSIEAKSV